MLSWSGATLTQWSTMGYPRLRLREGGLLTHMLSPLRSHVCALQTTCSSWMWWCVGKGHGFTRFAMNGKGNVEVEVTGNKPTGGLQTLLEKLQFQPDFIYSDLNDWESSESKMGRDPLSFVSTQNRGRKILQLTLIVSKKHHEIFRLRSATKRAVTMNPVCQRCPPWGSCLAEGHVWPLKLSCLYSPFDLPHSRLFSKGLAGLSLQDCFFHQDNKASGSRTGHHFCRIQLFPCNGNLIKITKESLSISIIPLCAGSLSLQHRIDHIHGSWKEVEFKLPINSVLGNILNIYMLI